MRSNLEAMKSKGRDFGLRIHHFEGTEQSMVKPTRRIDLGGDIAFLEQGDDSFGQEGISWCRIGDL